MYKSEAILVEEFMTQLSKKHNPLDVSDFAVEFNYQNGRVDVVGTSKSGELVSIEAKLSKWTKALNQAFRNTAFSHYSYVLLPKKIADRVKIYSDEFKRRSVGLCSFHSSNIQIEITAPKSKPIQPWLTESAISYILAEPNGKV
jgi:hypothetical protein